MKKSYEMDMCSGPLLSKILIFSIPLMISGILQLLFNAADIVVVGRFTGSEVAGYSDEQTVFGKDCFCCFLIVS